MAGVPMDQRDGWIWMDGNLVPWKDATIHVLTHGLHYASSVFEGQRAYGGQIFKLHQHSERLLASGRMLDMPIPYTADQLDAVGVGQRVQPLGEAREKDLVDSRQCQGQREGHRLRAACRQVGEVHGQRLVAQRVGRHGAEEVPPLHEGVGGYRPLHPRRGLQQRAVVAAPQHGVPHGTGEVLCYEIEFAN